jgi:uncharacterized ferritin-like protein (DUF455 family)
MPFADPGRPERPVLVPPQQLPRRGVETRSGRAALIHALAHIEFTAINLALDAAYRFRDLPDRYRGDWLRVAAEEAHHFQLLEDHLSGFGHAYGDFPAHAGLWEMARKSAHDPLVRMALVPRLLEARGLDATPAIRDKFAHAADTGMVLILDEILRDEIAHVAIGDYWYRHLCTRRGLDPEPTFRRLLRAYRAPWPRAPFNVEARRAAGFSDTEIAAFEGSA